jgi:hypothetical protein
MENCCSFWPSEKIPGTSFAVTQHIPKSSVKTVRHDPMATSTYSATSRTASQWFPCSMDAFHMCDQRCRSWNWRLARHLAVLNWSSPFLKCLNHSEVIIWIKTSLLSASSHMMCISALFFTLTTEFHTNCSLLYWLLTQLDTKTKENIDLPATKWLM